MKVADLVKLSAVEMSEKLAAQEISSAELTQAHIDVIDAAEPSLEAFLARSSEEALKQAEEVDKKRVRGEKLPAFAGVPVAVKDMIVTKGIETTAASRILEGWIPPYDATVVERMKKQGMPILGKTNLDEFAQGSSTETSAFHNTYNPWNTECVPGGSGGGSASAVAAFESPLALGTDTGGSVRQPASLTGTVGVKPTYGGVSRYGAIAMASSLDQIGVAARTVLDAAMLHEIIGGYDPHDSTSIPHFKPQLVESVKAGMKQDLSGLKVGIIKEGTGEGFQKDVLDNFNETMKLLEDMGADVRIISFPHFNYALDAYYILMPAEISSNLARYDGMRYGLRVMPPEDVPQTAANMMAYTRGAGFGSEVKRRTILGTYVLSAGYYDAWYGAAQKARTVLINEFKKVFEEVDVLTCPSSPTVAFKIGDEVTDPLTMYRNDVATVPANLGGLPAMSIPSGVDTNNLPTGVQFLAWQMKDEVMYKVAAAAEAALTARWGGSILQKMKTPWLDRLKDHSGDSLSKQVK